MKKLLLTSAFALIATPAYSYDANTWVIGIGYNNIGDTDEDKADDIDTMGFRGEFRSESINPNNLWGVDNVSLVAGVDVDLNGGTYGYGGLLYDWEFYQRWHLVPSIVAGLYHESDSKDLGGPINFRSALEVNYEITRNSRLGLGISHISNASIYDSNPGAEHVTATYSYSFK